MDMRHPEVTAFLDRAPQWSEEMRRLRAIALEMGLLETYKWRAPCYTHRDKNVAIIGAFNDCCTLSFFKGAALNDPDGLLQRPGPNVQAARLLRFRSITEIEAIAPQIRRLIGEAMEKYNLSLAPQPEKQVLNWPDEWTTICTARPEVKAAFEALTPGRQRGYLIHFHGAKKSATRTARIEKCLPRILKGIGMHDCICGLSKRLPHCDGSHKQLDAMPTL